MTVEFGERSLRYQELVKNVKAPSPIILPEQMTVTDEERDWMVRAGKDVSNALRSMKVQPVGDVVMGFNL